MKKPNVIWVTLVNNGLEISLLETDTPNVFKTDRIQVIAKGVEIASYEYVRDDPTEQKLHLYDIARGREMGSLGHYRGKSS